MADWHKLLHTFIMRIDIIFVVMKLGEKCDGRRKATRMLEVSLGG